MNDKKKMIFLGTLAGVLTLTLVSGLFLSRTSRNDRVAKGPIVSFRPGDVAELVLADDSRIVRKDGGWQVLEGSGVFPGNDETVDRALEDLSELARGIKVAGSSASEGEFGFSGESLSVVMNDGRRLTFRTGETQPGGRQYLQVSGVEGIFLSSDLTYLTDRELRDWTELALYPELDDSLKIGSLSVSGTFGDVEMDYTLVRTADSQGDGWSFAGQDLAVKKDLADRTSQYLVDLSAYQYASTTAEAAGLIDSSVVVKFSYAGVERILLVGRQVGEESRHYVKRTDRTEIFEVSDWTLRNLLKTRSDYLESSE